MNRNDASDPSLPPARVLVVDDEPDLRTLYELTLLREGHDVSAAGSLAEARELLAARGFNVVITDMRLPDGLGLELLRELGAAQRPERCIVITAYGSAENAVEALKHGAFDYLTKPVDLKQFRAVVRAAQNASSGTPDTVAPAPNTMPGTPLAPVQPVARPAPVAPPAAPLAPPAQPPADRPGARVFAAAPLVTPPVAPQRAPRAAASDEQTNTRATTAARSLARLVGQSPVMQAVKARITKIAHSMAPVLVRGESGTGKELVARAIHDCSHRAGGPFVPVNCGAIPENLLEAEFFGARKGAYTGATQDREGFFQAARGGTLFLDEIGDLPLAMQAKLLRAIQERSIRPLGETQEKAVDVRFISATHKDLAAEVQAGRFRQDLYYRLNVIQIIVPPLRERRADLPLLAHALLARIARETGLPVPEPSPRLLAGLQTAPLPGNVRELENILHRAVALGDMSDNACNLDELTESGWSAFAAPVVQPPVAQPPVVAATPEPEPEPEPAPFAATPPLFPIAEPRLPALPRAPLAPPAPNVPIDPANLPRDLEAWINEQERRVLVQALEQTGFNRTAAAARLGLNLRQIRYRMARLGIAPPGGGVDDRVDSGNGDE
ncbi:MAG: sigma-54 dependent transcriptional regulator [Burkholderiaceae bacterium]|jgi:two-component system response regulator PilR (NtrC family)|nr:sigma-54 dependent transcriptional regulator [Burkholderiaceae bacterium]